GCVRCAMTTRPGCLGCDGTAGLRRGAPPPSPSGGGGGAGGGGWGTGFGRGGGGGRGVGRPSFGGFLVGARGGWGDSALAGCQALAGIGVVTPATVRVWLTIWPLLSAVKSISMYRTPPWLWQLPVWMCAACMPGVTPLALTVTVRVWAVGL